MNNGISLLLSKSIGFYIKGNGMKRIAVIASDAAMPGEKGLKRMHYLAGRFAENGFSTELITSDFQHWEKAHRTQETIRAAREQAGFAITFLHEPAYSRNVDPKRILSYRVLARNLKNYLSTRQYDAVYTLIPDNHVAAVAGEYAKSRGIPFIVDIEDLWPEAMRMVFDVPVVSDALFSYFTVNAKKAYSLADAVVGSSDSYRDEPKKYGIEVPLQKTVYVGNDLAQFDKAVAENAGRIDKPEGDFWLIYAGTIGASYDLATLVRAADLIAEKGIGNIRTLILGDGPQRAELEALAASSKADIRFTGFLPFEEMAAYLSRSDITVNSLVAKAAQSIVSKIGDYLAAGIPMINTGLDREFCEKVVSDGFGVNVKPEDPAALADAILSLYHAPERRAEMGRIARRIAEQEFDRANTYPGIIEMVDSLIIPE